MDNQVYTRAAQEKRAENQTGCIPDRHRNISVGTPHAQWASSHGGEGAVPSKGGMLHSSVPSQICMVLFCAIGRFQGLRKTCYEQRKADAGPILGPSKV